MNLAQPFVGRHLGERRGQRGLAVVDVPDGADVDVRFTAIEFLFSHVVYALFYSTDASWSPSRLARRRTTFACFWARQPQPSRSRAKAGADDQNRTGDLVLTKDALCQLSYIGLRARSGFGRPVASAFVTELRADQPVTLTLARLAEARQPSSGARRLERETGIEPATNSLEGCDSTTELLPPIRATPGDLVQVGRTSRNCRAICRPASTLHVYQLTATPSPTCHQLSRSQRAKVGGEGRTRTFEATRATDLQSAAFDRSATSPVVCVGVFDFRRVPCADRTVDRSPGAPGSGDVSHASGIAGGAGGGI